MSLYSGEENTEGKQDKENTYHVKHSKVLKIKTKQRVRDYHFRWYAQRKPQRQYFLSHGLKEVRNYADRWIEEEQLENL